jgi:hypothetical protein
VAWESVAASQGAINVNCITKFLDSTDVCGKKQKVVTPPTLSSVGASATQGQWFPHRCRMLFYIHAQLTVNCVLTITQISRVSHSALAGHMETRSAGQSAGVDVARGLKDACEDDAKRVGSSESRRLPSLHRAQCNSVHACAPR